MKRRLTITVVVVLCAIGIVALLLVLNSNQSVNNGNEKVSVRMKWFFAGTMTNWFAGREEGIFEHQRIDLTIRPGGPDNNAAKLVAAGTDIFGVAGADELLMAREQGVPVVAIAVLFKDSPIGFISKKEKGITTPEQWEGKTIEVSYGSNAEVQYRALLKKYNIQTVKEVPYSYNLAPFIEDKVDVSVAYLMDQVVTLEQQGIKLNIIRAKDYGINPYGDVVITLENTLKEKPELVRRFIGATIESLRWSIENPRSAVEALVKSVPTLKVENESKVWEATIPFVIPDGVTSGIGEMELNRWRDTFSILLEFGFVKNPVEISSAFVNVLEE